MLLLYSGSTPIKNNGKIEFLVPQNIGNSGSFMSQCCLVVKICILKSVCDSHFSLEFASNLCA